MKGGGDLTQPPSNFSKFLVVIVAIKEAPKSFYKSDNTNWHGLQRKL